jgi:hypothetical protein
MRPDWEQANARDTLIVWGVAAVGGVILWIALFVLVGT